MVGGGGVGSVFVGFGVELCFVGAAGFFVDCEVVD